MRRTKAPRVVGRFLLVGVVFLAPWLAGATAAQGAETTTRIERVPLDFRLFLPCANDGAGEVVHLSGTFMMIYHVTFDQATGFHLTLLEVQQGVQGVGETTGDRYVSSFVNFFNYNEGSGSLPIISTQEVVYRVDGQGPGNESLIRIRNHSTLNANGTMTVAFDDFSAECLATEP
jgi:hypothetical protein